jgi:uncharacterized protein YuzE
MRITYDPKVDAAYISFREGNIQVTTTRIMKDIAIDFGPHEEIVGIEILDASEHLSFRKESPEVELENIIPA